MKNLLSILVLTVMFVPSALADVLVYGQDINGKNCASVLLEDGTCNIVYTNDGSLKGDEKSLDVRATSNVAQPNAPTNAERTMIQQEKRMRICLILGC